MSENAIHNTLVVENAQLRAEVELLRDAIDRSNEALAVAIKTAKELTATKLENQGMKKVVDAAMEWWADHNDSIKTIVILADACDAYSKVCCRGCGIVRERCPRIVLGLSALACCKDCSHEQQAIEKRRSRE